MEAVSKGASCYNKQEDGISRTPFDGLRTGFDTLLHYALRQPFDPSTRLRAGLRTQFRSYSGCSNDSANKWPSFHNY